MNKIASNIRKYRKLAGMSQAQLAEKLGKTANVISNWERGDHSPDIDTVQKMCDIFKITPNEFYGWENDTIAAHAEVDLTDEEKHKLEEYLDFLISQRKKQ